MIAGFHKICKLTIFSIFEPNRYLGSIEIYTLVLLGAVFANPVTNFSDCMYHAKLLKGG